MGIDRKTGQEVVQDRWRRRQAPPGSSRRSSRRPLKMSRREGNVLSDTLRNVWDGKPLLSTLVKNNPNAGHGRAYLRDRSHDVRGLRTYLADLDIANGLANRFLIVAIERTQLVPSPPRIPEAVRMSRRGGDRRGAPSRAPRGLPPAFDAGRGAVVGPVSRALHGTAPAWPGPPARPRPGARHAPRGAVRAALHRPRRSTCRTSPPRPTWWQYVMGHRCRSCSRTAPAPRWPIGSRPRCSPGTTLSLTEIREQIFSKHLAAGSLRDGLELLPAAR